MEYIEVVVLGMQKIPKTYEAKEVEEKIYNLWEKGGFFMPKGEGKPFVVAIPPPNITGSLHMGHALNNTIQDVLIRFNRMKQIPTLWIPGTDHAGIATQNKVEKELKKQGLTRHDLGREKFIKKVWQWKEKYGNIILDQLKKMGCSCDWSRTRFTLDKEYVKAVETAFEHYYKKGWIYKGPRIVNWCPRCSTAISDIEVKYKPQKTKLYYIRYPLMSQTNADFTQTNADKELLYKDLTYKIRGVIFEVKKKVGLGHKEIIYQKALEKEFKKANLSFEKEKIINIFYDGEKIGTYRPDFVIEDKIILEIKALPLTGKIEERQLWTYLKGSKYKLALLINFTPEDVKIKRVIYDTARFGQHKSAFSQRGSAIIVATTRPETMLGDTAVAVNPKDKKYKNLIGKKIILPLMNREIPIIADRLVDPEFGTGAVKVTPAHSIVDNKIGKEHKLETINVIGEDGKMTENTGKYAGLKTKEAREKIIEDLKKQNLIEKEEDYEHSLSLCDRCDTPIEPLISKQWFLKMDKLVKPAIKVVEKNKIQFHPKRYKKICLDWMKNIDDWCISRQLWWGHQIPVWYCGGPDIKRMGFAASIVPKLKQGKVTTWRLRDHNFSIGNKVIFINSGTQKAIGQGTILKTEKTIIGKLPSVDPSHHEGSWTQKKMIYRFGLHYPDYNITKTTPVWIYSYKFKPLKSKDVSSCGEPIVSTTQPKKCPVCGNKKFIQSQDVLDTWFSSALWPFATLGWPRTRTSSVRDKPSPNSDLDKYFPTTLLSTAQDIIYLWVARMIFSSLEFLKQIPFKDVYIHSTVLNIEGKRMSKSLGTGLDPLDLIEKYGADATRFGLLYITSLEQQQIKFSEDSAKASKNFANKLWNINRFISMNNEQRTRLPARQAANKKPKTLADKWILSRLNTIIKNTTKNIEEYKLGEASRELYEFVWHEYADWYVELSKQQEKTLNEEIFKTILKLLHPFMPFVTEQIWQLNYPKEKILIISEWPKVNEKLIDKKIEKEFEKIQKKIIEIRKNNPGKKLQDISVVKKIISI